MTDSVFFSSCKGIALSSQEETVQQQEYQSFPERETEQN
jgi:hypothetical protein